MCAAPQVGDRCNSVVEVLTVILEDDTKLDETLGVDLALMGVGNLNVGYQADSDGDGLA